MKEDILKRVVINRATGSSRLFKRFNKLLVINGATENSWLFKRFNKLQVIVTDKSASNDILAK